MTKILLLGSGPWSPGRLKTLAAGLSLILGAVLCGVEAVAAVDTAELALRLSAP
jgi:hypothetical protein